MRNLVTKKFNNLFLFDKTYRDVRKSFSTTSSFNTLSNDTEFGTTRYSELYNKVGNYTTI